MLSDLAQRRLVHDCPRVPLSPSEFVEIRGKGVIGRRNVRHVGPELRRVVWRDVEVRDALLAADDRAVWDALNDLLIAHGAVCHGLSLLDLVTAMSLECCERRLVASSSRGGHVSTSPQAPAPPRCGWQKAS